MTQIHNFGAGPTGLPLAVRERLADALKVPLDHAPSLLEVSHRGARFLEVAARLRAGLRTLLGLGDSHELLLMSGGAQLQFALLPMNLASTGTAAYLESGHWSKTAIAQARAVSRVAIVGSEAERGFTALPSLGPIPADAAYLHYCGNETIHGVQFPAPPGSDATIPLVADLSSEIFSRPYPFERLAVVYASAQKNLGIPGLTVVAVRRDLLERVPHSLPTILSYRSWAEADSMPNTPATAAWIATTEMVEWIQREGGLTAMAARNTAKATLLYDCLDRHDCFEVPVAREARSQMNVVFRLKDRAREPEFLKAANGAGLLGLEGHRAVGGIRVSLYNAVELASVQVLVAFLEAYAREGARAS